MKVVAVPEPEATGFYRQRAPMAALADAGHDATVLDEPSVSGLTWAEIGERIEAADVVVVGPSLCGRPFDQRNDAFTERRGVLVVDLDFDPWALAQGPVEAEKRLALESWLMGADLVTVPTFALAAVLFKRGVQASVRICQNAVVPKFQRARPRKHRVELASSAARADRLRARRQARAIESGEKSPVDKRVGWFGSTDPAGDLAPMLRALRLVMATDATVGCSTLGPVDFRRLPEWNGEGGVAAGGAFTPPGYRKIVMDIPVSVGHGVARSERVEVVPFNFFYPTLEGMQADVAVLPLAPTVRNASKSDVALLSWAVQGVAAVCSRTGPYREAEAAGFPAVYVDHGDSLAWAVALRGLLYDFERRTELAARAKAWVLSRRCFPAAVTPWEEAFKTACRAKGVEFEVPLLAKLNGGDHPIYDPERGP